MPLLHHPRGLHCGSPIRLDRNFSFVSFSTTDGTLGLLPIRVIPFTMPLASLPGRVERPILSFLVMTMAPLLRHSVSVNERKNLCPLFHLIIWWILGSYVMSFVISPSASSL